MPFNKGLKEASEARYRKNYLNKEREKEIIKLLLCERDGDRGTSGICAYIVLFYLLWQCGVRKPGRAGQLHADAQSGQDQEHLQVIWFLLIWEEGTFDDESS